MNGLNLGLWQIPGEPVTAVDWSIGTAPYGSSVGSGIASVVGSTLVRTAAGGYYDVVSSTLSFSGLSIAAGEYYLTLQDAVVTNGGPAFWDINNAAGIDAWTSDVGNVSASGVCYEQTGVSGTCASSFQILGTESGPTPEPSTLALLGPGLLAAFVLRRKAVRR